MTDTGIHEQPPQQGGNVASDATMRALGLVSQELMETIRAAHLALEECVDGRGGTAALQRAGEHLHQARGALKLTETYGAALLTEEMEAVCSHLANLRAGPARDEGMDALTRAMVQLPVYIERLLGGGRDIALVLLPLLNDLRAVRGKPLLSEGTLLLLNLSPSRQAMDRQQRETSGEDPAQLAVRLRPRFQLALLGLIKGGSTAGHLKTLADVAAALERAATRDDMYQLWWVLGGVLEALADGGLDVSVAIKRLLGQADRQMKRLIDEGPEVFAEQGVTDLLNNLLYYVARAGNAGPRISEIRAAFNLSELLPGDEQVAHARESLSAPSIKLMQTVGAAIKEDLGRVKDVLDIFVRTGMNKSSELVPQLDLLKKISDTLGVLGLGELRGDIDAEIDRLKSVVRDGGDASEQTVLEIASTLLRVEDRLDQQLVRLISPEGPPPADGEEAPPEEDADYRQVAEAVMRESIINLARIKETFSQSMGGNGDSHGVDSVPALVRGIKAGLLMLNKPRAMSVFERIGSLIELALAGDGPSRLEQREMDRLADAIVSIEYYMETVKAGRKDPWYMLDNAEACLAVLQGVGKRLRAERATETTTAEAAVEATPVPDAARHQSTSVMPQTPVVASDAEHLDPELLELFIEEAKEEIATIRRNLPQWVDNPGDMESLITVRRSFHTLKGSGRMVGAERVGEYCWSVENLLNRLINRTLTRTPPMVAFVSSAAEVVPELIEELEAGTPPQSDVALFMARANAFADGDPNAAVLTLASDDGGAAGEAPALEMDPVLLDIFSKETAGHLQTIRDFLQACQGHRAPFQVTDKLHRSCHTLHGSANMANVDRGVAVAGALNRYVRRVYDYQVGFEESGLVALEQAANAIEDIVGDINQADRERRDYSELIEHLQALTNAVETDEAADEPAAPPEAAVADDEAAVPAAEPTQPDEARGEPEDGDYDAEIAAIFSEEAAELLESADRALAAWSQDRGARQHVAELKRHLHTLKGGARMAGITAMGNLSHELETLLIGIDDGRIEASAEVDTLLQQSIDELHRMRDSVIAGKFVNAASTLEDRIRAVSSGGDSAIVDIGSADDEPGDEAGAAAFTIEPDEPVSMVIVDDTPPVEPVADEPPAEETPAEAPAPPAAPVEEEPLAVPPAAAGTGAEQPAAGPRAGDDAPVADEPGARRMMRVESVVETDAAARPATLRGAGEQRQETARIDADLLEDLLNAAGEISIYHSRLSQQVNSIEFHVEELEQTVIRLRDQLRKLEIETEAQIMHGHQDTLVAKDFDPLEMDRYSNIQQLSRALAESASDLTSLKDLLQNVTSEAETLLVQQQRVTAELQDGLMRTRMVPFQRHVPRLTRLVRQAASEAGKRAELAVEGASGELDRQVLEKMLPPFEHMMRNAVIHGIETPEDRQAAGKPAGGRITIRLHREGAGW
ncbi:MAG: Hpt domain-containing protein [Woeseiaceae bacterium]|nr:Hpt domain-containing protein [Woeseiaceae bacterium]